MAEFISDMLKQAAGGAARFSMPGHKGKLNPLDITEIAGADNLMRPQGCILKSQQAAAADHKANQAFFSVNGSSGCVLAMLAYLGRGAKVIVSRDFHISVDNGIRIMGHRPVYAEIRYISGQIPRPADTGTLVRLMEEHPDAEAVILTNPNYYGMCADLAEICRQAHRRNMLVLVDSAHGAHFPYSQRMPQSAGAAGADIWCVSCHKTLPSLNQSAILFCGPSIDGDRLKECLNLFQTTSPSYPILQSIESGLAWMRTQGAEGLEILRGRIARLKEQLCGRVNLCAADDYTRVVLDASPLGLSGFELEEALYRRNIWTEAADERNVILITTPFDGQAEFDRLAEAVREAEPGQYRHEGMEIVLDGAPAEQLSGRRRAVLLEEARGRLAAKAVFAYPPGVPVILAGQMYTEEKIVQIAHLRNSGYNLMQMDNEGRVLIEG